ncbi:MAG: isoprenylcysteine carboxylmethyltransferase family protein [Reinekea forsetii]|jgi:protein-S-isoprenylcysteine O-methyltransferase Ste14|uniref:Isoprenylcysteine carboxyl methyltransferase n=1 Tax=Reinekea forsetii TaxID=1336806 RepID=A0A2K8KS38_9GAMM|nr:isoprenylcysteine carboxylmethyltransferase family protein [Reinekea forsetii]ATX77538.1 isoprenylcysteine carboxyl methyltransferase [Reinekea forsetii]MDO7643229.1 isoprenylcysteine carboxylmethyltransferase family protein [Reinekea forsetii]MDO7674385.1 isoprenylcysteine carboxylmethyltransferase family protein [Reinekea forsetii]
MNERPPILPPALGLLMMLGVFSAHFIKPLAILLHYPFNYIGLIPIALGSLLNLLADREFRLKGMTQLPLGTAPDTLILVTSGVYRFTRNPSYLGLVLIIAGIALWVGSLSPWIVVILFPLFLYKAYIQVEESELQARFGSRYQQYCQLVPRWIFNRRKLPE